MVRDGETVRRQVRIADHKFSNRVSKAKGYIMKHLTITLISLISLLVGGAIGFALAKTTTVTENTKTKPTSEEHIQKTVAGNGKQSISTGAKNMSLNATTATSIDIDDPQTWEPAVTHAQRNRDGITRILISIAKDEARSDEDRRKGIFLLGEIDSSLSLDFLVENIIAIYLPLKDISGDEDHMKGTPCQYVLSKMDNWKVAQAILSSLDVPKSKHERIFLTSVFKTRLGKNVAVAVVEEHLFRKVMPKEVASQCKENLEAIRTSLLQ